MNGVNKTTRFILILLCVLWCGYGSSVRAEEQLGVYIKVEQHVEQTGSGPVVDDTFHYKLIALDAKNPMPPESACQIQGNAHSQIGPICFYQGGTYQYDLIMDRYPRDPGYIVDEQIYTLTYYVYTKDKELRTELVVNNEGGHKVDRLLYAHVFASETATKPSVKPTDPAEILPLPRTGEGTKTRSNLAGLLLLLALLFVRRQHRRV